MYMGAYRKRKGTRSAGMSPPPAYSPGKSGYTALSREPTSFPRRDYEPLPPIMMMENSSSAAVSGGIVSSIVNAITQGFAGLRGTAAVGGGLGGGGAGGGGASPPAGFSSFGHSPLALGAPRVAAEPSRVNMASAGWVLHQGGNMFGQNTIPSHIGNIAAQAAFGYNAFKSVAGAALSAGAAGVSAMRQIGEASGQRNAEEIGAYSNDPGSSLIGRELERSRIEYGKERSVYGTTNRVLQPFYQLGRFMQDVTGPGTLLDTLGNPFGIDTSKAGSSMYTAEEFAAYEKRLLESSPGMRARDRLGLMVDELLSRGASMKTVMNDDFLTRHENRFAQIEARRLRARELLEERFGMRGSRN